MFLYLLYMFEKKEDSVVFLVLWFYGTQYEKAI